MDVIYFEVNNWFYGRDYPISKNFVNWIHTSQFANDEWVKENKLAVNCGHIDMSMNYCITAPKEWVEENCSELLTDESYEYDVLQYHRGMEELKTYTKSYKDFVRVPEDDDIPESKYGMPFKEYTEDNIGVTWVEED